mgnify:CR=1 FL=1
MLEAVRAHFGVARPALIGWSYLGAVVALIAAPVAEEVFFRGFLFAGFARRYGFWVGALVSAVVFALVHLELARTVPAMLSGVVFAAAPHGPVDSPRCERLVYLALSESPRRRRCWEPTP